MPALTIVPPATIRLQIAIGQGPAGPGDGSVGGAWAIGSLTNFVYDSGGRLIGYDRDDVPYTIDYPDSNHIVIAGGGKTKTVILAAPDRIESIITT